MIKPPSACLPPNKMLLASLYLVLMKPWTVDLIHRDDAVLKWTPTGRQKVAEFKLVT